MKPARHSNMRESVAYAPRFLVSMAFALVAFAVVSYLSTGSVWTTVVWTLACAVLIQVGYFLALLVLVWKAARERQSETATAAEPRPVDDRAAARLPVSRLKEPGASNL
ncbi:exopolysaccharide production repressor protein [Rhizobium alarense]|uniref:exopolysaccharide production repressor protein n=1 Tax=Rhizobium alarense TaxID=2846851 RepID=UPI002E324228|nr:exopolysaccharide production repressor protein [Rhizobium alarense]